MGRPSVSFANYQEFRSSVLMLIEGDDTSDASFSLGTCDILIGLGETRAYRDLRASSMVMPLSIASPYALPADLIELKELYLSGEPPIEVIPLDKLRQLVASGVSAGKARYAAQDGDSLAFWPTTTATMLGSYYALPEALKSITWADAVTFARYPECFIFAALSEASPFLGFDSRIPVWEQKYRVAVENAMHEERFRVYGGSRLRVRAS